MKAEEDVKCSFCDKSNKNKSCLCMVAGPNNVFICDECIETSRDIVGYFRTGADKIIHIGRDKQLADNSES